MSEGSMKWGAEPPTEVQVAKYTLMRAAFRLGVAVLRQQIGAVETLLSINELSLRRDSGNVNFDPDELTKEMVSATEELERAALAYSQATAGL